MSETIKKRLGEILIEDGVLSKENLDEALNQQKKEGGLIGQLLIRLGYISEEDLIAAVGRQLRVPYIALANYSVNPDSCRLLTEEFCRKNQLMAIDHNDRQIVIATGDPLNETAVDDTEKKTGLKPQVFLSTPTEIMSMLDLVFTTAAKHKKAS